jgi:hypothetical protein
VFVEPEKGRGRRCNYSKYWKQLVGGERRYNYGNNSQWSVNLIEFVNKIGLNMMNVRDLLGIVVILGPNRLFLIAMGLNCYYFCHY